MIELGLTSDEMAIAQRVDKIAADEFVPIIRRFGERHEMSRELLWAMAEHDLFGLNIEERYGGAGHNHRYSTLLCIMREHLGYHDPTVDFTFGLQGLGTVAIVRNGTDAQRSELLPDLVAGRRIFAFALTEPHAGSDVRAMRTTATRDGDVYRLNGTKTYISGAPDAEVYVVVARTADEGGRARFTAFVVRAGSVGFSARQDIELSAPHAIGTLQFDDCEVSIDDVIGAEGDGLRVAFGTLEIYRPSVGALAVGMGRRAFDLALDFARGRTVSGRRLCDLEAIRLKLARMWVDTMGSRALVYRAAAVRDSGDPSAREAAMAKLRATESAHRSIYESQQIHGARGVTVGNEIETLFRHIRQATIYEGTSEIQRTIIGRTERDHPPRVDADGPLGVARSAVERLRSSEAGRALLERQGVEARFADVSVALDGAQLVSEQVAVLDGAGSLDADRFRLAAEVAQIDAVDLTLCLLTAVERLGSSAADGGPGVSDELRRIPLRCTDEPLLELAELLVESEPGVGGA